MDKGSASSQGNTQLLKASLDQALVFLTTQCGEMFAEVEPVFMEYASKAETNQAQARFFDAANAILSHRGEVESRFRKEIKSGFESFLAGEAISYSDSLIEATDGQALDVVDDDTLEVFLALQSMASKAQNRCYQELYGLGKRFAVIRGGTPLKDDDIPGCPAHTASAFYLAIEELGLTNEMLIILLFLFEKHVMTGVKATYKHINNSLIEAGIFPNLKLAPTRSIDDIRQAAEAESYSESSSEQPLDNRDDPTPGAAQSPQPPESFQEAFDNLTSATQEGPDAATTSQMHLAVATKMFKSINRMLASHRQQDPRFQNHPEYAPDGDLSKLRDKPSLISAIDQLTPEKNETLFQTTDEKGNQLQNIDLDQDLIIQVKETLLSERNKLYAEADQNTIQSADIDTIELVGMLFEEVLNEEELPNIAKALISHLHTPYLRIAVQDQDFLVNQDHLARKLLDLMIKAGCQWIDEKQLGRGIYYPMQESVNQIMVGFYETKEQLEEVYNNLLLQIDKLEERAKILEERNHEAARGRERLESSRMQVKAVIAEHIGQQKLHLTLEYFLNNAWFDRLILILLRSKNGQTGKEWDAAVKVLDAIVRINKAPANSKVKTWLGANRVGIKHHIKSGLAALGDHHQNSGDAVFNFIDDCLAAESAPSIQSESQTGKNAASPAEAAPPPPEVQSKTGKKHAPKDKPKKALSAEEKAALQLLQKTAFGTWFELTDDNDNARQLKLSWFSPVTHKYMFVDRFGAQAHIAPIEDLARGICLSKVKIISKPKQAFMDRAMKKIHSLLEHALGIKHSTAEEQ